MSAGSDSIIAHEASLQRLVTAYIATGLLFLLLPGTFLGVWNLIAISERHAVGSLSPSWIQAHGHAQLFGWLGTFIIGIGFYSLSKMGHLRPFAVSRGWLCWALWTMGVSVRWAASVYEWRWRTLVPLSAALELAGFLVFFQTVLSHRSKRPAPSPGVWMRIVAGSSIGFLLTLLANLASAIYVSVLGVDPAIPHWLDQRLLALPLWGFLVPSVWGFNARWLPVFLGLEQPWDRGLLAAFFTSVAGVLANLFGRFHLSAALFLIASALAITALRVFEPARNAPKTQGIHPSFTVFVRIAYAWLLVAAVLSAWAAGSDRNGGIWGASRHALTVGFLATMVFSIGPRILPAFCGMKVLYSKKLMLASLALLNAGCALRVFSEIPAYEGYARQAWTLLPASAVIELAAVAFFCANLGLTFLQPPAHLRQRVEAAAA